MLVLDRHGTVLTCTAELESLVGRTAEEICGRPATELLARPGGWSHPLPPPGSRAELRHAAGGTVEVQLDVLPLRAGADARYLVAAMPAAAAERRQQNEALVRALFTQTRIGLAIHDTELRLVRVNLPPELLGIPAAGAAAETSSVPSLEEVLLPDDAVAVREQLRKVAETGVPLVDWVHSARLLSRPEADRIVSLSGFRLEDSEGRFTGVAATFTDVTEQERTRQQLALVGAAAKRLEGTLDVVRCAEQLVEVMVPEFADLAVVDLTEAVLVGEEPGGFAHGSLLRRVALAAADGGWPDELHPRGMRLRVQEQDSHWMRPGSAVLLTDMGPVRERVAEEPELRGMVLPEAATSMLVVPLNARGLVLGGLLLWRTGDRVPFGPDDAALGEEIGSRAALSMDSARRYTREHRTAEALQRSLLPRAVVKISAAETVGLYVPAATTAGIGGSWFDVIALSSSRIALVVGDVVGHGLEATAATGRLRTAVQTLSDLDMTPEELLTHLDDLVRRLAAVEESEASPDGSPPDGPPGSEGDRGGGVYGSTCLYAVYDPVTGHCSMASAGHPPPVVVAAGEAAGIADLKPGPALGVGGEPFEQLDLGLPPGSVLALFTEKLLSASGESPGERLRRLCAQVESAAAPQASPAEVGRNVLDNLLPEPPEQDLALLVSRVRALPASMTAAWEFPGEPTAVAEARELVIAQLTEWRLEELAFTTELIASELVTNSIRYAGAPVGLRLIRDKVLMCEVSDPSQTQPRLRRARPTDEGGRGLFLIAQLAHRWGSRYTRFGKTIWTEQLLPPG
ncbi:ATP-binding SpoIIE family protein phosphatase [Peterkaempfera bronchialis]|uniref:ATP-binding SpoIIE family protein phosphatase n=1 Tax=Peterkaempfera bronchialis TaxID=2126346 RepID=UPI002245417D|nr:SpoIIE family protein phosphatase [Peterkaempfera bronchialis]